MFKRPKQAFYNTWISTAENLLPEYDYFDFANFVNRDKQSTNLFYNNIMKMALQRANGENKLTIANAINKFNSRGKLGSQFGQEYNEYWEKREQAEHEERIKKRQKTAVETTNDAACASFESIVLNVRFWIYYLEYINSFIN
ncbi:hypothetical protein BDF21DRAFT_348631 [Thamnidium elegans]|nr:hypothetical protein BDF21DRAFT_348631 [Thamnidium elegans]